MTLLHLTVVNIAISDMIDKLYIAGRSSDGTVVQQRSGPTADANKYDVPLEVDPLGVNSSHEGR
jgi:hypothetical protein